MELENRSAIVTGASRGLGLEIARSLSERGADVLLVGRSPETLEKAVADISTSARGRVATFSGDVRDSSTGAAAVAAAREAHGSVDILVNNAQEIAVAPLHELSREDFTACWESGPMAAVSFMQAALPDLEKGGVVINLLSGAGVRWDMDTFAAYGAAKQAMTAISRTAACEWGPRGVRVLGVMPVAVTDAWADFESAYPDAAGEFVSRIPLRRMGTAREVGETVALLCTSAASYMTGSVVKVDGGLVP